MLLEQQTIAEQTRDFLVRWGLKSKYVAKVCGISEKTFSRFLNHKLALSQNHICQLTNYIEEYERRNNSLIF